MSVYTLSYVLCVCCGHSLSSGNDFVFLLSGKKGREQESVFEGLFHTPILAYWSLALSLLYVDSTLLLKRYLHERERERVYSHVTIISLKQY